MNGPPRKAFNNGIDRAIERFTSDQERQRIEIALNWSSCLDVIARKRKLHGPIQTDRVDRNGSKIRFQPGTSAARKANDLCAGNFFTHCGNNTRAWLNTPFPEFTRPVNFRPRCRKSEPHQRRLQTGGPNSSLTPQPPCRSAPQTRSEIDKQTIARDADRQFHALRSCRSPASTAHRKIPAVPPQPADLASPAQLPRRPAQAST